MIKTPKALRLHLGIFGRINTGKSSFINTLTGQKTSIVSHVKGTTTDIVQKNMELYPIGPVTFLDTPGIDDNSELGALRMHQTKKTFESSDIAILLLEANIWTDYEEKFVKQVKHNKTPLICIINKIDTQVADDDYIKKIRAASPHILQVSCRVAKKDEKERTAILFDFKHILLTMCPDDFITPPSIMGDLLLTTKPPHIIMIVPIDIAAPKGRLIMPQVQSIRDGLDNNAIVSIVKEREYSQFLHQLKNPPNLVICDSQIVKSMVTNTPSKIQCTTFSTLFSRYKGDIKTLVHGARQIAALQKKDVVLIAEACTHHPTEDDIGRVKIPRWLDEFVGFHVHCDHCAGIDYPENISDYKLIIHCGACTLTRRQMLYRIEHAQKAGVAITNYGIAISLLQGVLDCVLSPFNMDI
ncbi:MAG TPA: [FeFe] hydrogenase H-cluster maturation GTPase HydF [Treponemataceae bacterium]|nr:[FeFe] hydrogenase H-cluster maturation GTPase HydF [Treponemataceae bacterium]